MRRVRNMLHTPREHMSTLRTRFLFNGRKINRVFTISKPQGRSDRTQRECYTTLSGFELLVRSSLIPYGSDDGLVRTRFGNYTRWVGARDEIGNLKRCTRCAHHTRARYRRDVYPNTRVERAICQAAIARSERKFEF